MTIARISAAVMATTTLAFWAASAHAQVIGAPSRSTAAEPSQDLRQSLVFTSSTASGWDENETAGLTGGFGGDVAASGNVTFVDAGLQYTRSRGLRSTSITGRGYMNAYPGSDIENGFGGETIAQTTFGTAATRASLLGRARYEPFFSLGAFTPVQGDSVPLDSTPIAGLAVNQHTWSYDGGGTLTRQWGSVHSTAGTYTYARRDRRGQGAFGSDTGAHNAQVTHLMNFGRYDSLGWSYVFQQASFMPSEEAGSTGDLQAHAIEMTVNLQRRLARQRRLLLVLGGGAQRASGSVAVSSEAYSYWTPSAVASLRVDLGRTWALHTDYRRGTSTLDSVTQRPFTGDTVQIRLGGNLSPRVHPVLMIGYSGGQSPAVGETGRYDNYMTVAQVGFDLVSWCTAVVSYSHYRFSLADLVEASNVLPRDFGRNAVRAGLTIGLPLIEARRGRRGDTGTSDGGRGTGGSEPSAPRGRGRGRR